MRSKAKRQTLRQAAWFVFTLTAVLPLLMFAYALVRLNGLRQLEGQIALGLALMAVLVGFGIWRVIMGRMSDLLRAVGHATEQGEGPALATAKDLRVPGLGTIQEFPYRAKYLELLLDRRLARLAQPMDVKVNQPVQFFYGPGEESAGNGS